jgi:DNA polymerase-3 subunit epsilon
VVSGERDVVSQVPSSLLVDAADRMGRGIRISLPPRKAGERSPYPLGWAEHARAEWLAQRYRRYGEGWASPGEEAGNPGDGLRSLEYVVVDVETTGGSAWQGHRVTEVAVVRLRGDGKKVGEYSTLVNPDRSIPPFITRLTRITPMMAARAPRFPEVAEAVRQALSGAVFVAHNASFDWRFLSTELDWAQGKPLFGRVICTVRLARRVVPEISRRSLDALSDFFGVYNQARHRAFGDARATAEIFGVLLDRLEELQVTSWAQLEALLGRRAPRRKPIASPHPVTDA